MQDLSHLTTPGFPSYGASMAGGNTVTDKNDADGLSGSKSEGSADIPSHNNPDLEMPSTQDKMHKSDQGTGSNSGTPSWKKLK